MHARRVKVGMWRPTCCVLAAVFAVAVVPIFASTGTAPFATKGYWHGPEGLLELSNDSSFESVLLFYINQLSPYNAPTAYFEDGDEPFDGFFADGMPVPPAVDDLNGYGPVYNEISQFLVDRNANKGDPRERLAQQLLAFIFNAHYRLGGLEDDVCVDGSPMKAEDLIDTVVDVWAAGNPKEQREWQDVLAELNDHYDPATACP